MRHRGGRLASAIGMAAGFLAACSLVRSLDGFSDEWGKPDAAPDAPVEAATDAAPDVIDSGIRCDEPVVLWNGGVKDLYGPYLHGMDQDRDYLYVTGGAYANDAAPDAGFVLRIQKAAPNAADYIALGLNAPTAVTRSPDGVYACAGRDVVRVADDGGAPSLVKQMTGTVFDLASDPEGLFFVEQRPGGTTSGFYFLADASFQQVGRVHPFANRVLASPDAIYVSRQRDEAGAGLVRYPRDAAFDDATVGCTMEDSTVLAASLENGRTAWGNASGAQLVALGGTSDCSGAIRTTDPSDARPLALAIGSKALFARYAGYVKVFTLAGEQVPGCTKSLVATDEATLGGRVTKAAVSDGEWFYFMSPQRVYGMRVRAP